MPDHITDEELYEQIATDILPPVPEPDLGDNGYDWMDRLPGTGWQAIAGDRSGRQVGNWPYQIIAHHNDPDRPLFGIAIYTEGDMHITGYRDRAARDEETRTYYYTDD